MEHQDTDSVVPIEDELLIDESELSKDIAQIEDTINEEIVLE